MKKMSKKFLALVMAMAMVIGMLPMTVFADTNTANIEAAISDYETYMESHRNDVLVGMDTAYNAYVDAKKELDKYNYGGIAASSLNLNGKATALNAATANLSVWSEANFTGKTYQVGADMTDGYSNVVWSDGATLWGIDANEGYVEVGRTNMHPAVPGVVVLGYKGNKDQVYFPMEMETWRNNSSSTQRINFAALTDTSVFTMKDLWRGYSTTWNAWAKTSIDTTDSFGYQENNNNTTSVNQNSDQRRFWYNIFYYNKNGNTTDYYDSMINPSFSCRTAYNSWGWQNKNGTVASRGSYYVINYEPVITNLASMKTAYTTALSGKTIADFSEGGMASLITAISDFTSDACNPNAYSYGNAATDVQTCAAAIKSAVQNNSYSTPVADSYQVLRDALDYDQPTATNNIDTTVKNAYTGAGINTSDATWTAFTTAYDAAVAAFNTNMYNENASALATALLNAYDALLPSLFDAPAISPLGGYLGYGETITLTPATETGATSSYRTKEGDGSWSSWTTFNDTVTLSPYTDAADFVSYKVETKAVKGSDESTDEQTFKFVEAPTAVGAVSGTVVLGADETIVFDSEEWMSDYYYSIDNGTTWVLNDDSYAPFLNSTDATKAILAKAVMNEDNIEHESKPATITFVRNSAFDIAVQDYPADLGNTYYNSGSSFVISSGTNVVSGIQYSVWANGAEVQSATAYNGVISASDNVFQDNRMVTIRAFYTGTDGTQSFTEKTFYNADLYAPLAFHESFDDVTIRHSNTYSMMKTIDGVNTNLGQSAAAISVEKGAGTYMSGSTKESHSWRNNVLKIPANSTAPGPVVTMTVNPLATAEQKDAARANGVTISFWRHLEDGSGNTVSLPSTGDPTGYPWRNAIAFQKDGDNNNYYIIEVNGVNSRCEVTGQDYLDVVPENQDNTQHEEGNNNGEWEHVAVTIDPDYGIHVYTNGVEHEYKYATGAGTLAGGNNAVAAQRILDFLTQDDTKFTFDNGVRWEGNEYNLFLDDIRIYSDVLTQVDINNMYTDKYSDTVSTSTSTSHDPTSVTVYTLTNNKKVGQEYIEANNIPESDIAAIDYYSFGTGMTIYHATDASQTKWEVLGDSQGRCGYQNHDLFGDDYKVALDAVRQDLGVNASTGAGYLVWAPHVMYNLQRDCWVYYASMSSWGAVRSRTFMCTSSDPISGYQYQSIIYRSNSVHPNSIDFAAFYGHNTTTNAIDPSHLYFVIGSWGHAHSGSQYDAIYGDELSLDGTYSHAGTADYLEANGTPIARGYTADLESDFNNGNNGESQGSGEGAWVTYIDGYYYLFVSYGQNEGSYAERVWRSKDPLGRTQESSDGYTGYVSYEGNRTWSAINDSAARDFVRGNQLIAPFDMSMYDTVMRSTGHSSLYKVKTLNNEWVWVNAIHGRPYATESHGWVAVPDNALAKRQSGGVTGNVCMNNMVALNEDGWMVIFPNQYNGTDSYSTKLTAKDLEGVYAADDMRKVVNSAWGTEYKYTILADKVYKDQGVALGYKDGIQFTSRFKLTYDDDKKIQYITMYTSADVDPATATPSQIRYKGVVGTHIGKDKYGQTKLIPMLGMINTYQGDDNPHALYKGELAWAYRSGEVPNASEVVSKVDAVALDGVIYTHASDTQEESVANNHDGQNVDDVAKSSYALYGQEIADNFGYKNGRTNAERYVTLTVAWPMKIDLDNPSAIYNYSDEEHTRDGGCTGSEIFAVPLNKASGEFVPLMKAGYEGQNVKCHQFDDTNQYWYDESTGNTVSDAQIAAMTPEQRKNVVRYYGLTGYVSDYFKYNEDTHKYTEDGVELIITYVAVADSDETDPATGQPLYRAGQEQQEFEFAYVMPNPGWAHTIAGVSNNQSDLGNERNSSMGTFNRFEDSWGKATGIYSNLLWDPFEKYSSKSDSASGYGHGVSGYLSDFENHTFGDQDLDTIAEIKKLMVFTNENEGTNSGSFSCWYHSKDNPNAYAVAPDVVDCNYYVDYSNEKLYDNGGTGLITTSNGVPTGYTFKMVTNNFLWNKISASSLYDLTCYQMNNTGLNVTYSSTYDNEVAEPLDPSNYSAPAHLISLSPIIGSTYNTNFNQSGIMQTNLPSFNSCNTFSSGKTKWFDDAMLYHTDCRDSNAHISFSYRNKVLWFFSDKNVNNMGTLKADTTNQRKLLDNTSYSNRANATKIWNYYDYTGSKAYKTLDNGKGSTHDWHGEAIFTGKDSVIPNQQGIHYYDGYWYDTGSRRYWTSDYNTAAQYGEGNFGQLEVTAENYANYILEMGSYHKVTDLGADGGRFLGKENYHYYNIGVHTCDKGAMRQFAEEMMNQDIHEDPETGEIVIEGTTLDNARYSYASYKDYLDAIGKCMWFVEDPTKTTFGDIKDEARYIDVYEEAKQMYIDAELNGDASQFDEAVFDATEYTTAYNTSDGKAYYLATQEGRNIFRDGTTKTDYVQAALVKDVLKAYEDLYDVNNYVAVEDEFKKTEAVYNKAVRDNAAYAAAHDGDQLYSTDSMINYQKALAAIRENAVNYYVYDDPNYGPHKDTYDIETGEQDPDATFEAKDRYGNPILDGEGNPVIYDIIDTPSSISEAFWRTTDLTGEDYDNLKDYMIELRGSLSEPLDTNPLGVQVEENTSVVPKFDANGNPLYKTVIQNDEEVVVLDTEEIDNGWGTGLSKAQTDAEGIFNEDEVQTKTYPSWKALDDALYAEDEDYTYSTLETAEIIAEHEVDRIEDIDRAEYLQELDASAEEMVENDKVDDIITNTTGHAKYAVLGERLLNDVLNLPQDTEEQRVGFDILKDASDSNSPYYSRDQLAINKKAAALAPLTLEDVDTPSAYDAYNNTYAIVSAVDLNKYLDATLITTQLNKRQPEVYIRVSQEIADAYNARVGIDKTNLSVTTGRNGELRVLGIGETDPYTADLLTAVNTLDSDPATYVKKFKAQLTVSKLDNSGNPASGFPQTLTAEKYYGETFEFNVPGLTETTTTDPVTGAETTKLDQAVTYSISTKDGLADDFATAAVTGSTKWTYKGTSISRVADSNIEISANIVEDKSSTNDKMVKFYNIYGRAVQTSYVSGAPVNAEGDPIVYAPDGETVLFRAETVPFYYFDHYQVTEVKDASDNITGYEYKAKYAAEKPVAFTIPEDATLTGGRGTQASLDDVMTLSTEASDFYAWAVKDANNKYAIASYDASYTFYAVDDTNFAMITKVTDGDDYTYQADGVDLTAAMISGTIGEAADNIGTQNYPYDAEQYLKEKLDQKAPFISVISSSVYKNANGDPVTDADGKYLVKSYAIVTSGTSNKINNVTFVTGVTVNGTRKTATANITNINDYGQFTVTVKVKNTAPGSCDGQATLNYKFTYTYDGNDYTINAKDTTVRVASPQ